MDGTRKLTIDENITKIHAFQRAKERENGIFTILDGVVGYVADPNNGTSIRKIQSYCKRHNVRLIGIYHADDLEKLQWFTKDKCPDNKSFVLINRVADMGSTFTERFKIFDIIKHRCYIRELQLDTRIKQEMISKILFMTYASALDIQDRYISSDEEDYGTGIMDQY